MVLCQHCKEIFRSTRSLDAHLKASSHCQRAATAKLIEQSQELLLRAVASSRDNEDNGMDNQDSISNADESVAPSHESSVREQYNSDESMEEETPGVERGESMEEETSGVESSDASSSRDSDTTMSSQTSRTLSDDVSSNNSMDAQGGGASKYNAEADDDYDDDGLAGTNVESEAEEEDSMIMIEDFFFTEDDAMRLTLFSDNKMNDYNNISLDCAVEDLMVLIKKHNLPPVLFKEIMDWGRRACQSEFAFESPTYPTVLRAMLDYYSTNSCGAPIRTTVSTPGVPPTGVYHFKLLDQLERLYRDPSFMENALWKFNGIDKNGQRTFGELNSGTNWEMGEKQMLEMLSNNPNRDATRQHYLSPLIVFDDSASADNLGRLTAQPILFSTGNICGELRRSPLSWLLAGILPPYPKSSKERELDKRKESTKLNYLKFYQACVAEIIQEIFEMEKNEDGFIVYVHGKGEVRLHFRLCHGIGDTSGQDDQCCHYHAYSSVILRMCRDCNIGQTEGDNPWWPCEFVVKVDMEAKILSSQQILEEGRRGEITNARKACQEISQHPFPSVFFRSGFCGCIHGVFGNLPYELLHLWYLGLIKYLLLAIFRFRDVNKELNEWFQRRVEAQDAHQESPSEAEDPRPKGDHSSGLSFKLDLPSCEKRLRVLTHASRRQSDRNFPKTPFKNGVTGLTRLTGQEYVGLCLLVMVMLKGTFSQIEANNSKERREWEKVEDDFILLCMLTLSLDTLLIASKYTEEELVELESKIRHYLAFFRNVVGPQREMESKSGLRFQKFHGLVHIPRYIRKLGNTFNFFGGFLERVLKDVVKQRTKRTTRQQDNLSLELMKRYREAEVCEAASRRLETTNYYKNDLSVNLDEEDVWEEPVQSADYTANPAKGLHSYAFTCCLGPDGTWMTHVPGSNSDIKGSIYPRNRTAGNNACVKAVCDDAANEGYSKVLFYYALATNSAEKGVHDIFRCHPDYRSLPNQRRSWYDWAMVQFVNDSNRTTCEPARVFVWAHYEKLDANDNNVGPIMAVVHPLEQDEPKSDSVLFFATAGRLSKKHSIVARESIAEVAYVLPSIEHRGNAFPESVEEAEYFVAFPPRISWGDIGWDELKKRHNI